MLHLFFSCCNDNLFFFSSGEGDFFSPSLLSLTLSWRTGPPCLNWKCKAGRKTAHWQKVRTEFFRSPFCHSGHFSSHPDDLFGGSRKDVHTPPWRVTGSILGKFRLQHSGEGSGGQINIIFTSLALVHPVGVLCCQAIIHRCFLCTWKSFLSTLRSRELLSGSAQAQRHPSIAFSEGARSGLTSVLGYVRCGEVDWHITILTQRGGLRLEGIFVEGIFVCGNSSARLHCGCRASAGLVNTCYAGVSLMEA